MKNEKGFVLATTTIILIVVIVGAAAGTYVAKDNGYLPWIESPFIHPDIEKPVLCKPDSLCPDGNEILGCKGFFELVETKLPVPMKSNHYVVSETPEEIMNMYSEKMMSSHYKVLKDIEGIEDYEGYTIHYALYIKGITLYLILATSVDVASQLLPSTCVYVGVGSILGVNPDNIDPSIFSSV